MSDEFAAADVVFTGTVVRRDEPFRLGDEMSPFDPIQWTFAVDGIQKGFASDRITISSPRESMSCGILFALGHRYLVRAHASGLFGLEAIQGDADEIEALATAPPIEAGGINVSMPGAAVVVLLFGALAIITVRVAMRRRSPSGDR